jgi:hypothetical protein
MTSQREGSVATRPKRRTSDIIPPIKLLTTSFKTDKPTLDLIERIKAASEAMLADAINAGDLEKSRIFAAGGSRGLTKKILAGRLITWGRELWLRDRIDMANEATDYAHCLAIDIDKRVWGQISSEAIEADTTLQILSNSYLHLAVTMGLGLAVETDRPQ